MSTSDGPDLAVQQYYACFNERRLPEAAALFSDEAVLQLMLFERLHGPAGHAQFSERWIQAFPDAQMHVNRCQARSETLREVDVRATGTHLGTLEMGAYRFTPSGCTWSLDLRQLFEFRDGRIVFSSLSFDIHEFIHQVAQLDLSALKHQLERIRRLSEELDQVQSGSPALRAVMQRLGTELDAARRILRPYFYK